jgi:hypothetical protein
MAYRLVFTQLSASYDASRAQIDGPSETPAAAGNRKIKLHQSDEYVEGGKGSSLERKSCTGEQSHQSLVRLPAVYPFRFFAELGGLLCYGNEQRDQFRLAANYVNRVLRGAKPSELPVQAPVKFELVINLKTARALALTVPQNLLVAADEVIE